MAQVCVNVTNLTCFILAPVSEKFSANVYNIWGSGGIAFLVVPAVLTLVMLLVFAEEAHYILQKSTSKELRNALLWILGTYPAIMIIGTLAAFIPRAVVYLSFIYNIFVAYAIYKYFYLILVFVGGSKPFVDKCAAGVVPLNNIPCCCLVCLPRISNSERVTEVAKWLILQNVIFTPLYGALGVLLKSDSKLYSLTSVSASVYLSTLSSIATLLCMYGFNMVSRITKTMQGMEEIHSIKGKTLCMQLTMFITGFEGVVFNILAVFDLFPCEPPLNFISRRRVIFNYAVVIQVFFLGLMARHFYRRKADIQRHGEMHDQMPLESGNHDTVFTAVNDFSNQLRNYNGTGTTTSHQSKSDDNLPSTSANQSQIGFVTLENDTDDDMGQNTHTDA